MEVTSQPVISQISFMLDSVSEKNCKERIVLNNKFNSPIKLQSFMADNVSSGPCFISRSGYFLRISGWPSRRHHEQVVGPIPRMDSSQQKVIFMLIIGFKSAKSNFHPNFSNLLLNRMLKFVSVELIGSKVD
jgi:hypothetical protein